MSWTIFEQLRLNGYLKTYQGHLTPWLCGLDGTQYFGSTKIHCDRCTVRVRNGQPAATLRAAYAALGRRVKRSGVEAQESQKLSPIPLTAPRHETAEFASASTA